MIYRLSMLSPGDKLLDYLHQHRVSFDNAYLRESIRTMAQALMELEVGSLTGADRHERSQARQVYRNGYRRREWVTSVGEITLAIPKLRKGTYYPSFFDERGPNTEGVLYRLALDAYVQGVEYQAVRSALDEIGLSGVHRSKVAEICQDLDDVVRFYQDQAATPAIHSLYLDVVDLVHDQPGRAWVRQLVLAWGEGDSGGRDLLAHELVTAVDDRVWLRLLRRVRRRGLEHVERVVSDDYEGLRLALYSDLLDMRWELIRSVLDTPDHANTPMAVLGSHSGLPGFYESGFDVMSRVAA